MSATNPRKPVTFRDLERKALDAHRAGTPWLHFWQTVAMYVRELEPYDRAEFHRLADQLLCVWATGRGKRRAPS